MYVCVSIYRCMEELRVSLVEFEKRSLNLRGQR